ncbi:peptidylprolyl isomerase [Ligilactobacillus equi]|nr:peptidylprolyl isomerase [Ligilactobacillus equi]KRL77201.1 peptidylprolyl isomerase [Ligilactobacillus equi DSM 15833 = JCM 10991]MCQ2557129.1 peptidylprolyl isomerase [Ligilactobacillus sp.]
MKKWLVALAGILMTFSLAACSKTVATTAGGKITESEYYSSLKQTSSGKQVLQEMILNKLLEHDYGKKVSSKQVTKEYNAYKNQYGSSFELYLTQSGLTKAQFKEQIRSSLLMQEAVKANTKITNKMIDKQWKKYQPTITVAHILVDKKSTAEDLIKQLQADPSLKNFKKLAKKNSTDTSSASDGGVLPSFNNTDTDLASKFKKAAFALKQGEYTTTPVKTSYGYHIIYSVKNPGKGQKKDHISELKSQIISEKMNDSTYLQKVLTKVLKKGKVNIKDSDLKDVLANYLSTSTSSSSSK